DGGELYLARMVSDTFEVSAPQAIVMPADVVAGDLNHDGFEDLLISSHDDGVVVSYLSDGQGNLTAGEPWAMELIDTHYSAELELEDYNDDGHLDVIIVNGDDLVIALGDGEAHFEVHQTITSTSGMFLACTSGDVNGDGVLDLLATVGTQLVLL